MKEEIIKGYLDYLAVRIAEEMSKETPEKSKVTQHYIDANKRISECRMSGRLEAALIDAGLGHYTIRELSEVNPACWHRVRWVSRTTFPELMRIFANAGCSYGDKELEYDYCTRTHKIV